jgi:hypothetical protein
MLPEKIIRETLAEIPVGFIPNHKAENLPALVKYHVLRSCALGSLAEEGSEILKYGHTPMLYAFIEKLIKTDENQ